jgi:hypothetical protein
VHKEDLIMRLRFPLSLLSIPLLTTTTLTQGAELTACIVDMEIPSNPVYYYLPTMGSRLRCEINRPDYHPTLPELYAEGWRIVGVVDPKVVNAPGAAHVRPSAVFYLERSGGVASVPGEAEGQKSGGGLFGFF